jgi:hypothetical protein
MMEGNMNRLSQLLIDLNKQRLPDEYIDDEVVAYIEELKLELGVHQIEDVPLAISPEFQQPVFCICTDAKSRRACKNKKQCIPTYS